MNRASCVGTGCAPKPARKMRIPTEDVESIMNDRMMLRAFRRTFAAGALLPVALAMAGCTDTAVEPEPQVEPDTVPEAQLTFVRFSPALLDGVERQGSVWAVAGENREIVLRYAPENPGDVGKEFLEFRVKGGSLLRRPDGTAFAPGDSILITVEVGGDDRFLFRFEPSGLEFSPNDPAELDVRYDEAVPDLNDDGVVDNLDLEVEAKLSFWKQESLIDPWIRVATVEVDDDELEADITGFTGFALAF